MKNKIIKTDFFETLKHSKNYFSANVANKAIIFISIPIFTRLFSEADYGVVATFTAFVGIMTVALSLNSYSAVGRYYYEKTDDFGEFVGTTLVFAGTIFVLVTLFFILFYKQISNMMQLPDTLTAYLLFASLFAIIYSIYQQTLVPQKKSKEAAAISMIKGYSVIIMTIIFICLLKDKRYLGQVWATLLVGLVLSIYFLVKINKYAKLSFNLEHIKYIIAYSVPLIPHRLSAVILAQFDRIMINSTIDSASAGLYSLGYNVGMLLLMVITSTQTALTPDFFKFLDAGEHGRLNKLVGKVFSIITVTALGLIFFAKEIVILLADEKFHPGLSVVPVVVVGYLFYGMATVYNRYISYTKKTVFTSVITLVAGFSNIVLNLIFIPKYGYIAAAYTTAVSYFIMFLLTWIVSKIFIKQEIVRLWSIWKSALLMFAFIGLAYLVGASGVNAALFFLIKLAMLAVFCSIVFHKQLRTLLKLHK